MTKREYILEKSEELFAEKGFDATSVRDISKAAGINIAMVSYYFGSKDRLIEELFKMRMMPGLSFVKEIASDSSLSVIQKIDKSISGYVDRVKSNKQFYKVILAEQAINRNKNVIKILNQSKETYVSFYSKIIEDGFETGIIRYKIDPVFFITTLTGTLMQCLLNKEFYKKFYGIKKAKDCDDADYFDKVKTHLKSITKNILGYEYAS